MMREHPGQRVAEISGRLLAGYGRSQRPQPSETVEARMYRAGVLNLANRIAREHKVPFDLAYASKSRCADAANARHHLLAVLRWSTDWSFPQLARLLNLDHTTVIAAVNKWDKTLNGRP